MQWGLDGAVVMLWAWAPFSVGHAVNTGAEAHDLASPASASHTEVTEGWARKNWLFPRSSLEWCCSLPSRKSLFQGRGHSPLGPDPRPGRSLDYTTGLVRVW